MTSATRQSRDPRAPNLLIIGAPKCGTTTMDAVLRKHPQVFMSDRKEPRFFSRDSQYAQGFDWYLSEYFGGAAGFPVRGEATPTYMHLHAKTIPRIVQSLPVEDLRFIAILRNPIDRAHSHYWMNRIMKTRRVETLSFEAALEMEDQRLQLHQEWQEHGIVSFSYFRTGLYADQLHAFFKAFGRDRFLVLQFEDLFPQRFAASVRGVEEFLGIDALEVEYTRKKESIRWRSMAFARLLRRSRPVRAAMGRFLPAPLRAVVKAGLEGLNSVPFKYPEMEPGTRRLLAERYRASIEQLRALLGRDLAAWRDWQPEDAKAKP